MTLFIPTVDKGLLPGCRGQPPARPPRPSSLVLHPPRDPFSRQPGWVCVTSRRRWKRWRVIPRRGCKGPCGCPGLWVAHPGESEMAASDSAGGAHSQAGVLTGLLTHVTTLWASSQEGSPPLPELYQGGPGALCAWTQNFTFVPVNSHLVGLSPFQASPRFVQFENFINFATEPLPSGWVKLWPLQAPGLSSEQQSLLPVDSCHLLKLIIPTRAVVIQPITSQPQWFWHHPHSPVSLTGRFTPKTVMLAKCVAWRLIAVWSRCL